MRYFSRRTSRRRRLDSVQLQSQRSTVKHPAVDTARVSVDATQLEDRTLYSATPIVLDALQVQLHEDGASDPLSLDELFDLKGHGPIVEFSIAGNSNHGLFDQISIDDQGDLSWVLASNEFGSANIRVMAKAADGFTAILPVEMDVESRNDAPVFLGFRDLHVSADTDQTIIDLRAAFDDVEDGPEGLTFAVADLSHSDLFSDVEIDHSSGTLILHHADGAAGTAQLTITATDSGGLTVGVATGDDFAVYDQIYGKVGVIKPDTSSLGLAPMRLWTHWFFFDTENGQYQFDDLDVEKFRRLLHSPEYTDNVGPIVFDIENDFYDNSVDGRNRFTEVLQIANEERPELSIGYYSFLPQRVWSPVIYYRGLLDHLEKGIESYFTLNETSIREAYADWIDGNALYRTATGNPAFGDDSVASLVDTVNPSLYTLYRNISTEPIWRTAQIDVAGDRLIVDGPSFEDIESVRIRATVDGKLPSGLNRWIDYYVINAVGSSFQIAATPDGPAIDLDSTYVGQIYIGAQGPWKNILHDPSVANWTIYAEEHVAEARKFDRPVYAWLSPSYRGIGVEHLEYDFFRLQLETLKPIVDGIVIYEPPNHNADYHENAGWWHALGDFMDSLDSAPTTFKITIGSSPVAADDVLAAMQDQALVVERDDLLDNDDADGDGLSITIVRAPQHGKLQMLNDGRYSYTPNTGYHGTDSFEYLIDDGVSQSDSATVTLQIHPVASPPPLAKMEYVTAEDQSLVLAMSDLLPDFSSDDISATELDVVDAPLHGTVHHNQNGEIVYTPEADYHGSDRFAYRVTTEDGQSSIVTIHVSVNAVNDAPTTASDQYSLDAESTLRVTGAGVLANDKDAEGDDVTVSLLDGPAHGVLTLQTNGSFAYRPHAEFSGDDRFRYLAKDEHGATSVGEVRLRVVPLPPPPIGEPTSSAGEAAPNPNTPKSEPPATTTVKKPSEPVAPQSNHDQPTRPTPTTQNDARGIVSAVIKPGQPLAHQPIQRPSPRHESIFQKIVEPQRPTPFQSRTNTRSMLFFRRLMRSR